MSGHAVPAVILALRQRHRADGVYLERCLPFFVMMWSNFDEGTVTALHCRDAGVGKRAGLYLTHPDVSTAKEVRERIVTSRVI